MNDGEKLTLTCADGTRLGARHFVATEPRGVVVFGSAMAVPQRYYAHVANFFASHNYACITFDYRGIGESRQATNASMEMSFYAWGEQDIDAAIAAAKQRYPQLRCAYLGHSSGAQLLPLSERNQQIDRFIWVASGSAYWACWRGYKRVVLFLLWHALLPLLGRLTKTIPGALLGSSQGVPSAIARDWARCAREPRYIRGRHKRQSDARYDRFDVPTQLWSIEDDDYAPPQATQSLLAQMPLLKPCWRNTSPHELGRSALGHFGWFRSYAQPLWQEAVAFLDEIPTCA